MGRIIGIDYGQKRTGLAVTDPEQRIATVLASVPSHEVYSFLEDYITREGADAFVVGFPRKMNYEPSESAQYVQAFIKGLEKKFPLVPVYRIDERLTSRMAVRSLVESGASRSARRKKENIDAVSAIIILESWLQQQKFKELH